jgi:C-terminal processing protease CtpA/Prc
VTGALHFTSEFYFTPPGRSIQAREIYLDIEISESVPAGAAARTEVVGEAWMKGIRSTRAATGPACMPTFRKKSSGRRRLIAALDFLHSLERAVR